MKLITRWTKHLKEKQEQQEFSARVFAAKDVLERLSALIEEDLEAATTAAASKSLYKDSNWALYQADHIGEVRAFNKLLKIIDLTR